MVAKLLAEKNAVIGFDAQTEEYGDTFKAGVIDPAKVVRSALQNAASVAGLIITTEASIAEAPKKEKSPALPTGATWTSNCPRSSMSREGGPARRAPVHFLNTLLEPSLRGSLVLRFATGLLEHDLHSVVSRSPRAAYTVRNGAMSGDATTLLRAVRRWLPPVDSFAATVLTVALIAIAVLARIALDAIATGPLPPYITLYPAVVMAAFAGGVRIGAAAVVISAAIAWRLWISPHLSWPPQPLQAATGLVYLFTAGLTVLTAGGARLLLDRVTILEAQHERTARESVHRVKNLIAVVQSLSRDLLRRPQPQPDFQSAFEGRLRALAVAQDLLLRRNGEDVSVASLVNEALAPFLTDERIHVRPGVDIIVPRAGVTGVGMALYELATNALKYGALAHADGLVRLQWSCDDARCSLEWREAGAAYVSIGETSGFGATLIRAALDGVPDAQVRYAVTPQGVTCIFEWDAPKAA